MLKYVYDGSFEGLMTAIYEAYYLRQEPDAIVPKYEFKEELFSSMVHIETELEKAKKVITSIKDKLSPSVLLEVFYVFLSEKEGSSTLIYQYLKMSWQAGGNISGNLSDNLVRKINQICQQVKLERHRMLGLLRFRLVAGDIYYATMEPDNNILALIAPHFVRRLADQNWIIHDLSRGLAALYNQKDWVVTTTERPLELVEQEKEEFYQELWREYFTRVAVEGRINPRLQRQFMPTRYWKHLIEKQL